MENIEEYLINEKLKLQSDKERLTKYDLINDKIGEIDSARSEIDNNKKTEINGNICQNPFELFGRIVHNGESENENLYIKLDSPKEIDLGQNHADKFQTVKSPTVPLPDSSRQSSVRKKKSDEMEQWVTDAFYSYFPSLNKIEENKRSQSRAQLRQEYNEYLNHQVPLTTKEKRKTESIVTTKQIQSNHTVVSNSVASTNRSLIDSEREKLNYLNNNINHNNNYSNTNNNNNNINNQSFNENRNSILENNLARENSPRYKHLEDLKHTDLSAIISTDIVAERNKKSAEEEHRKKMEYQRELVKQIEEKRLEIERLKQKDKYEEQILTRKLEEQFRTLELEEQLEKERIENEKIRLINEQNHLMRMHILSKLENDHKIYNPYDETRKTQSENGKDKFIKGNDDKIYKFFTNSAKYDQSSNLKRMKRSEHFISADDDSNDEIVLPEILSQNPNYCKKCFAVIPEWMKFYYRLEMCEKCLKVCPLCHHSTTKNVVAKSLPNTNRSSDNNSNNDHHHNHHHHQQLPTNLGRKNSMQREKSLSPPPVPPPPSNAALLFGAQTSKHDIDSRNTYRILENSDTNDDDTESEHDFTFNINPLYIRNKKPYSINLEKDSIFNPNKKIVEPKLTVNIKNGAVTVDKQSQQQHLTVNHSKSIGETKISPDRNLNKQKENEKLNKYSLHYDDLRSRRRSYVAPISNNNNKDNLITKNNSQTLPKNLSNKNLKEINSKTNLTTAIPTSKSSIELSSLTNANKMISNNNQMNINSKRLQNAFRILEGNNSSNNNAVQQNFSNNNQISDFIRDRHKTKNDLNVLTQLGAIRKQLQLEHIQFDNTNK